MGDLSQRTLGALSEITTLRLLSPPGDEDLKSGSLLENSLREMYRRSNRIERRGHTDISSKSTQSFLDYTPLKQRISGLSHLLRTRARSFHPGFQHRLHEAQSVITLKTQRQRYSCWMAGFTLRQYIFLVRLPDIVKYVAAATRIDAAAVHGGALYTEGVGGWRSSICNVAGETGI